MSSRAVAADKMRQKALKKKLMKQRQTFGTATIYKHSIRGLNLYVVDALKLDKVYEATILMEKDGAVKEVSCPLCGDVARWESVWEVFRCKKCKKRLEVLTENEAQGFTIKRELPKTPTILEIKRTEYDDEVARQVFYKHNPDEFICEVEGCKRQNKPFKTYDAYMQHYLNSHAPKRLKQRYVKRQTVAQKNHILRELVANNWRMKYRMIWKDKGTKKQKTRTQHIADNKIYDVCPIADCLKLIEPLKNGDIDSEAWAKHMQEHAAEMFANRTKKAAEIICPICGRTAKWAKDLCIFECKTCYTEYEQFKGYGRCKEKNHIWLRNVETDEKYIARIMIKETQKKIRMVARGRYKAQKPGGGNSRQHYDNFDKEAYSGQIKLKKKNPTRAVITEEEYIE